MKDLNDEEVIADMTIEADTLFQLENELRQNPARMAKYAQIMKQAVKDIAELKLNLKVITAQIVEEIVKKMEYDEGKPVSSYTKNNLIKTDVPLDPRYQKAARDLNEAIVNKTYAEGLVAAGKDRGWRLKELIKLEHDILVTGENSVREDRRRLKTKLREANSKLDY